MDTSTPFFASSHNRPNVRLQPRRHQPPSAASRCYAVPVSRFSSENQEVDRLDDRSAAVFRSLDAQTGQSSVHVRSTQSAQHRVAASSQFVRICRPTWRYGLLDHRRGDQTESSGLEHGAQLSVIGKDVYEDRQTGRKKRCIGVRVDLFARSRSEEYVPALSQHPSTFLCGAVGMIEVMETHGDENGVDGTGRQGDRFGLSTQVGTAGHQRFSRARAPACSQTDPSQLRRRRVALRGLRKIGRYRSRDRGGGRSADRSDVIRPCSATGRGILDRGLDHDRTPPGCPSDRSPLGSASRLSVVGITTQR